MLNQALDETGTVVCEPVTRVRFDLPAARLGPVISALARLGTTVESPQVHGDESVIVAVLPAAYAHSLHEQLPGLTGGEGTAKESFGGYQPVPGSYPVR
jgi:ribosomal protection tetracycline resistance protein